MVKFLITASSVWQNQANNCGMQFYRSCLSLKKSWHLSFILSTETERLTYCASYRKFRFLNRNWRYRGNSLQRSQPHCEATATDRQLRVVFQKQCSPSCFQTTTRPTCTASWRGGRWTTTLTSEDLGGFLFFVTLFTRFLFMMMTPPSLNSI